MKYLLVLLIVLVSCSSNKKMAKVEELSLVSTSMKTTTSGMQQLDGKTRSTNYRMEILKPKNTLIKGVWIQELGFEYEEFNHEGVDYIVVQVYMKNQDNVVSRERPIKSEAVGLVQYEQDGKVKYLEVPSFDEKESIEGI